MNICCVIFGEALFCVTTGLIYLHSMCFFPPSVVSVLQIFICTFLYTEREIEIWHFAAVSTCCWTTQYLYSNSKTPTFFLTSNHQLGKLFQGSLRVGLFGVLGFFLWQDVTSSLFLFPSLLSLPVCEWSSTGLSEWLLRSLLRPSSSFSSSSCAHLPLFTLYLRLEFGKRLYFETSVYLETDDDSGCVT